MVLDNVAFSASLRIYFTFQLLRKVVESRNIRAPRGTPKGVKKKRELFPE
jgi:hypothetical protein